MSRALSRALKERQDSIEVPWPDLAAVIGPQPGQLLVIIGAPGVGKTAFATNWAYGIHSPVLYMSLDTDLTTLALRVIAMKTGLPVKEVSLRPEDYEDSLTADPRVRWSELPMTVDDLEPLLEAEHEYLGAYPQIVVVDVVSDILPRAEESVENYNYVFAQLHQIARKYRVVIMALHHVKRGDAAGGNIAPTLADGVYGGERRPSIVLGVWRKRKDRTFHVAILKNRQGEADPTGRMNVVLGEDLERGRISTLDGVDRYLASVGR